MAHPSDHRSGRRSLRCLLVWVSLFLAAYIIGRPILWRLRKSSHAQASCPSCDCDCVSENFFSVPWGFSNSSFSDCGENDPDMNREIKKDSGTLLSEELNLQKDVMGNNLAHTRALISDAKRASSHFQREAEKCNAGVESCEEAREKAEAGLIEELKLSALWEKRAREYGWMDGKRIY